MATKKAPQKAVQQADVEAPVTPKRKPALKRKGALEVMIAVGLPKKGASRAPMRPGREAEASPADAAEDEAEYANKGGIKGGMKGGMCECPECGHQFRAGEHMTPESEDEKSEDDD